MPLLHDPDHRDRLQARLKSLNADTQRSWGIMTVDQMVWHLNAALNMALGRSKLARSKPPLPLPLMRIVVIDLPWPKNLPTHPSLKPSQQFDFETERATTLKLVDEFAQKDLASDWGEHPLLGRLPWTAPEQAAGEAY